jgi:hypothetical protein
MAPNGEVLIELLVGPDRITMTVPARPETGTPTPLTAMGGEKVPPRIIKTLMLGRMNTLAASSGIVATFSQNVGHTPPRVRYDSTLDT